MPPLERRGDWPARLAGFLAERQDMAFAWGPNDCCSFAIHWVAELTGRRVFDIDWTDARAAFEKLSSLGGIRQAWRDVLGPEQQNWRMLRRGDVAIAEDDDGNLVGMVCTGTMLAGPGVERMMHLTLDRAVLVWNVG